ncbi:NAD(P)H-dependent oxidoreductase [Streptomyces sp. ACA25]|uniref:NADPH-dependent FMN reductase n=1 Tax=Streptomyces sp. ACA25 TaxID=3022596 RepID=UPI0023082CCF|nr:NAD(P)H-dependent oxidoreductase [Streptomyces sp. ACA25]MDB1086366.1 NAD(P)H-dependent oxidoreductase [Streptomyces sp. ACA25]
MRRTEHTEHTEPLRVAVLIGSTREGRVGAGIGNWFAGTAKQREDLVVDVVDLDDFSFPDRYPGAATPEMERFTARIGAAEAFVVVTAEYNRSFPASLKQAIDYGYDEWRTKPVGFVSYGYLWQGLHAVEQLRSVFTELHAVTLRDGVSFDLLDGSVDETGAPALPERAEGAATTLLDALRWWGLALREGRAARPYVT